jgi:hypothetical protein
MRRLAATVVLAFAAAAPAAAAVPTIHVTISASHTVKANAKWPVIVRVTNAAGKPLAGTLTNNILLGGIPVGKVDNGKVWHFSGSWREPKGQEITWPAAGKGQTFGFQTVVRVSKRTVKKTFLVTVH